MERRAAGDAAVKGAKTAAQVLTRHATQKAAASRVGDDMADRTTLEKKRGQRRLPAV